ncbi:hypothetical protein MASR1M74_29000 [Lentimicrobium sp.]
MIPAPGQAMEALKYIQLSTSSCSHFDRTACKDIKKDEFESLLSGKNNELGST